MAVQTLEYSNPLMALIVLWGEHGVDYLDISVLVTLATMLNSSYFSYSKN
jgi:hypothetical protein